MKQALLFIVLLMPFCVYSYVIIDENPTRTTWTAGTYYILSDISVAAGTTLNIESGSVVKFAPGTKITVSGSINAGGGGVPVCFTSRDDNSVGEVIAESDSIPNRGDWRNIDVSGVSSSATFNNCIFRFGGGGYYGNLLYINGGSTMISYCTFTLSACYGVVLNNTIVQFAYNTVSNNLLDGLNVSGCTLPIINHNTISANGGMGVNLYACALMSMPYNTIVGNTRNVVHINQCSLGDNITWPEGYIPEIQNLTIPVGYTLTTLSTAVVKFGGEGYGGIITVNGTLNAAHTVFTSWKDDFYGGDTNGSTNPPAAADWGQISVNSGAVGNVDHCTFRYGGYVSPNMCPMLWYYDGGTGSTTNSQFYYSSGSGLGVNSCTTPVTVSNNSFSFITDYPFVISYSQFTDFPGISISNCTKSAVYIEHSSPTGTVTLTPENVVVLLGISVPAGRTLNIAAGTIIKVIRDGNTNLNISGIINATGTETNPVVFTSLKDDSHRGDTNGDGNATSPAQGNWGLINIASGAMGSFEHCVLRYGGFDGNYPNSMIYFNGGTGSATNCHFSYSYGNGVGSYNCPASPVITNNTFDHINSYPISINSTPFIDYPNNAFTDCPQPAILISYSSPASSATISSNQIYVFQSISIPSGKSVTINPGVILKFDTRSGLNVNGTLIVNGTDANPVILTALTDDTAGGDTNNNGTANSPFAGYWSGISIIGSNAVLNMTYTSVRYSGCSWTGSYSWAFEANTAQQATFEHCNFTNLTYSFNFSSCPNVTFQNCVLDTGIRGINLDNSPAVILDCQIRNIAEDGLTFMYSAAFMRGTTIENCGGFGILMGGNPKPSLGELDETDWGLNTIRYSGSGYDIVNLGVVPVNAYMNHWTYNSAAEIDTHIFDAEDETGIGQVLFEPWYEQYFSPMAPEITSVTKSGNDVVLQWNPVTQGMYGAPVTITNYLIQSSPSPDADSAWTDLGTTTGTEFIHANGLIAERRFYRIKAISQ